MAAASLSGEPLNTSSANTKASKTIMLRGSVSKNIRFFSGKYEADLPVLVSADAPTATSASAATNKLVFILSSFQFNFLCFRRRCARPVPAWLIAWSPPAPGRGRALKVVGLALRSIQVVPVTIFLGWVGGLLRVTAAACVRPDDAIASRGMLPNHAFLIGHLTSGSDVGNSVS